VQGRQGKKVDQSVPNLVRTNHSNLAINDFFIHFRAHIEFFKVEVELKGERPLRLFSGPIRPVYELLKRRSFSVVHIRDIFCITRQVQGALIIGDNM
jgi:hypothetical protein